MASVSAAICWAHRYNFSLDFSPKTNHSYLEEHVAVQVESFLVMLLGQVPLPDDLAVLRQLRDSLTHERRAVVEKMQGGQPSRDPNPMASGLGKKWKIVIKRV